MIYEGTILLLAVTTLIALINAVGLFRTITRGFKMDGGGFNQFNSSMNFMALGIFVLALGHVIGLVSTSMMGMYAQGIGALVFVVGVTKMTKIGVSGKKGSLSADWGELEKEIEATKLIHRHDKHLNIEQHLENKNLLLMVIDGMGIAPVFQEITEDIPSEKKVFPIIGVITPYDLKRMWGELGNKGGFWMTASDVKDEWVNQKFVVGKPTESFQLTNYIKTVSEKYGAGTVYIGDFFDEMHSSLNDAQRQQLLSRMKVLLQQSKSLLILIVDKGVHGAAELELMERYADGKMEMSPGKTVLHDFQTNETVDL